MPRAVTRIIIRGRGRGTGSVGVIAFVLRLTNALHCAKPAYRVVARVRARVVAGVGVRARVCVSVRVMARVRCFVVTGGHKGVLCVWQYCGRRRCCIWAATRREGVQHADSDAGWRLGRRDSSLNLDSKTQNHRRAHSGIRL